MDSALTNLRALVERTGDTQPLVEALEARAEDDTASRDALYLEAARLRVRPWSELQQKFWPPASPSARLR